MHPAEKIRKRYSLAGGKLYLELSINRAPMGSEINISEPPVIAFKVRSHACYTLIFCGIMNSFLSLAKSAGIILHTKI